MSSAERSRPIAQRLVLIVTAMAAMGIVLLAIQRSAAKRVVRTAIAPVVPTLLLPDEAIRAEAMVFRTRPGTRAAQPDARRRPDAHPRTLATYRLLRSYPGAPPRVPHGLTATEFRTNRCNTCHERGGYSQRFGAYAPVNPHPEWGTCLQCHATNDLLVGLPFPSASPDDACRQCHSGAPRRFEEEGLDWRPAAWPVVGRTRDGVPAIPHDLQTRSNCLSCHMGPGAVAEIRTAHSERANCRQCHVGQAADAGEFMRPVAQGTRGIP